MQRDGNGIGDVARLSPRRGDGFEGPGPLAEEDLGGRGAAKSLSASAILANTKLSREKSYSRPLYTSTGGPDARIKEVWNEETKRMRRQGPLWSLSKRIRGGMTCGVRGAA